jgi:hypothetical protein
LSVREEMGLMSMAYHNSFTMLFSTTNLQVIAMSFHGPVMYQMREQEQQLGRMIYFCHDMQDELLFL